MPGNKVFKVFLVSCGLFLLNFLFPFVASGQQGGGQTIVAGTFTFAQLPANFTWSPNITVSGSEQSAVRSYLNTVSGEPDDSDTLLIIQDLRNEGDFRIDLQVNSFSDGGGNSITGFGSGSEIVYVGTTAPGDTLVYESINGVGYDLDNVGPQNLVAPVDMGAQSPSDISKYPTSLEFPVTILEAPGPGYSGRFAVAVNLGVKVPAFTPAGDYVAVLEYTALEVGSTATDAYDPTDDTGGGATGLFIFQTEQTHADHTLSGSDTEDFFSVDLASGNIYNFNTIGGTGDTYIEIYSAPAATPDDLVAEDKGYAFTGGHANMTFQPDTAGTYYVKVRTDEVDAFASYVLKYIEIYSGFLDAYDPGDDKADLTGANPTALGAPTAESQVHGPHKLSSGDLYDWYTLTLDSGVSYNFNATGGTGDTYAELFSDAAGTTLLASDDDSGGGLMFSLNYTPGAAGTYYLRVRQFGLEGSSTYSLNYASL